MQQPDRFTCLPLGFSQCRPLYWPVWCVVVWCILLLCLFVTRKFSLSQWLLISSIPYLTLTDADAGSEDIQTALWEQASQVPNATRAGWCWGLKRSHTQRTYSWGKMLTSFRLAVYMSAASFCPTVCFSYMLYCSTCGNVVTHRLSCCDSLSFMLWFTDTRFEHCDWYNGVKGHNTETPGHGWGNICVTTYNGGRSSPAPHLMCPTTPERQTLLKHLQWCKVLK